MAIYAVEYTYEDAPHLRDMHRPAHRTYLAGLADTGEVLAYGRFDDGGGAGALLLLEVASAESAAEVVARDPYVTYGVVARHRVRSWDAHWGAGLASHVPPGSGD